MAHTAIPSPEQALTRALAESQAERARLQAETERLREIVDRQAAWAPLGDGAHEATAVVHTDGCYSVPWVAIFADPWRAEQYVEWARTTQLPETADAADNPDYCYPLNVDTLQVRVAEDQVAFWNSYRDAPKGHARSVAEILDETIGDTLTGGQVSRAYFRPRHVPVPPDLTHDGEDEMDEGWAEFMEACVQECKCCRLCSDVPCGGTQQGAGCDRMPCECGDWR